MLIIFKPVYTNISFWYVPTSLKGMDKTTFEYKEKLNNVKAIFEKKKARKVNLFI